MCTLLFSPSSSLLFLIFINKTFPFILHLFTLFWIFPSLPLFLSLDLCIYLLFPFCHIFYLCPYSFSFLSNISFLLLFLPSSFFPFLYLFPFSSFLLFPVLLPFLSFLFFLSSSLFSPH